MKYTNLLAGGALSLACIWAATPSTALELPQARSPQAVLGALADGANYKVVGSVRSDGLMYLFNVETPYGNFQVNGEDSLRQRIQELKALRALEGMSQSDMFAKSFGQAVAAPVRFGVDIISKPGETVGRSISGVTNMFDQFGASMKNRGTSRDTAAGSLLGVDAARRQLAISLGCDPYTDFAPLSEKLQEIAGAMAMGGLTVRAALSAIPGGAGMAISSTATMDSAMGTLRDKTSAQIIEEVKATLQRLKVPSGVTAQFMGNKLYTPSDILVIAKALSKLNAANSTIFVQRAAQAKNRDVAVFQRKRAELLAEQASGISEFVTVAGFPLNRTRNGDVVAVFPLDDVSWTAVTSNALVGVTGELKRAGLSRSAPVLATNARISPMAASEIAKLGWKTSQLTR